MATTKNGIGMYFHCRKCITEKGYDEVAVGYTPKGIQIWCDSCDSNILAIDFQGQKFPLDKEPDKPNINSEVGGQ